MNTELALSIKDACRVFPRDIVDIPRSVVREMLLPRSKIQKAHDGYFYALKNISLDLEKGATLGIIGTHRSGKSVLAKLASGIIAPTSGKVKINVSTTLLAQPTAGFKPTLTLTENLRIRSALAGFYGKRLSELIGTTLDKCGIPERVSSQPIGNLSSHVVKQAAMTLLLEFNTELLIVDELTGMGVGDVRWKTRGHLQEKISNRTSIVIISDFTFLSEVTEKMLLLHDGMAFGPFEYSTAIEHYWRLPESIGNLGKIDYSIYDARKPPISTSSNNSNQKRYDIDEDDKKELTEISDSNLKSNRAPIAQLAKIVVEGDEYNHSRSSLIRNVDEDIDIELKIVLEKAMSINEFRVCLHPEAGAEIGCTNLVLPNDLFSKSTSCSLSFKFTIPDIPMNSYGLSITPIENGSIYKTKNRLKILKFGLLKRGEKKKKMVLDISEIEIIRENLEN